MIMGNWLSRLTLRPNFWSLGLIDLGRFWQGDVAMSPCLKVGQFGKCGKKMLAPCHTECEQGQLCEDCSKP